MKQGRGLARRRSAVQNTKSECEKSGLIDENWKKFRTFLAGCAENFYEKQNNRGRNWWNKPQTGKFTILGNAVKIYNTAKIL